MAIERLNLTEGRTDILSNEHWLRYQVLAPLVAGKRVLDLACGSGYGANYLAEQGAAEVIGVDVDEASIKNCDALYRRANLKFISADALNLPLADQSFDLIVSLETIEHFTAEKQPVFLQELKRVLTADGLLALSTPNTLASRVRNPFHFKELTREELSALLEDKFSSVRIYEQGSALATFLEGEGDGRFEISSDFTARYYLALAANRELGERISSLASLNPLALAVKENNPLTRIIDQAYSQLNKLGPVRKIFKYFSERTIKTENNK